jgi:hypothetical protein
LFTCTELGTYKMIAQTALYITPAAAGKAFASPIHAGKHGNTLHRKNVWQCADSAARSPLAAHSRFANPTFCLTAGLSMDIL